MKLRIGFPIFDSIHERCHPVWVTTVSRDDIKAAPRVTWNSTPLDAARPFGNNSALNRLASDVSATSDIAFICELPHSRDDRGRVFAEVRSTSAGLLLALAAEYELPPGDASFPGVLLSGQIDPGDGSPQPLGLGTELRSKVQLVMNDMQLVLGLLEQDYSNVNAAMNIGPLSHAPAARFPDSAKTIVDANTAHHRGWCYVLPHDSLKPKDWVHRVGTTLGLQTTRLRRAIGATPGKSPLGPFVHDTATLCDQDNIFASLLAVACPSEREYMAALCAARPSHFMNELLPAGLPSMAMAPAVRHHLFGRREDRQSFGYAHVLLGGSTGTGKTLLAQALMLNTAMELTRPALYVGPTRALIYQLYNDFKSAYALDPHLNEDDVVCSTGEETSHDRRIRKGAFKVAFVVNEKANLLLESDATLIQALGLVVIDEVHMIAHEERGGVIDMLVAKIQEANHRRAAALAGSSGEQRPVRLCFVSTENYVTDDRLLPHLTNGFEVEPLVLVTTERIVPVEHRFVLLKGEPQEVTVVNYKGDADRQLTASAVDEIVSRIAGATRPDEDAYNNWNDQIVKLLADLRRRYKRVLVVSNSTNASLTLARRLKNQTGATVPSDSIARFSTLLSTGIVSPRKATILKALADSGIFLHNAEMHRKLRKWIERTFAEQVTEEGPSLMVFATETLMYGVNLAADAVVILDIRFTRTDPHTREVVQVPLTPNEYHNALGRAGRPNHLNRGIPPVALVCIPAAMTAAGSLRTLLDLYYTEGWTRGRSAKRISALLSGHDVAMVQRAGPKALPLDAFSYPTFRTVMDGLRHTSASKGTASADEIAALLDYSVYAATLPEGKRATTASVVSAVLRAAAADAALPLASPSRIDPNSYSIHPQAEALIDTGTSWRSVRPVRDWLVVLNEHKNEFRERPIPVELLVPGLIASIDMWLNARMFCCEYGDDVVSTHAANERASIVRDLMKGEIELLGFDATAAEAYCRRVDTFVDHHDLDGLLDPVLKRAAVGRLVTVLLRWLRGASSSEVEKLSFPDPTATDTHGLDPKTFQSKIYERAAWLAVMCLRFFQGTQGALLPEHSRDVLALAIRLRHGVSSGGLPFLQYASDQSVMNREVVQALLRSGLTPEIVLSSKYPVDTLLASLTSLTNRPDFQIKVPRPDEAATRAAKDLFKFYINETDELVGELTNSDTSTELANCHAILKRMLQRADRKGVYLTNDERGRLHTAVLTLLRKGKRGVQRDPAERDDRDIPGDVAGMFVSADSLPESARREDGRVVVHHPFALSIPVSCTGVHVSSFGALVIASAVARSFVTTKTVAAWARSRDGTLVSIRDITEGLAMRGLPSDLREVLLGFFEPSGRPV